MRARIVIPRRGRGERLATCLHYLSAASAAGRHQAEALVVDDSPQPITLDPDAFPGLTLRYHHHPAAAGAPFSRAALLNAGIAAPGTWDWCGILDLDMIVCADYLDRVGATIAGGYLCLQGAALGPEATAAAVTGRPPFGVAAGWPRLAFVTRSQIAFTPAWLALFREVFGAGGLYDERFEGWGYQDTLPDLAARLMAEGGLADKRFLADAWLHLHHEAARDLAECRRNLELAYRLGQTYRERARAFLAGRHAVVLGASPPATALPAEAERPRPAELERRAVSLAQSGALAEAAALLEQALGAWPERPDLLANLGEVRRRQGRLEAAGAALERALRLQPDAPVIQLNLGRLRRDQGREAEAVAHYREATRLAPDYVAAHFNLGNLLRDLGRPLEAVAAFEAALRAHPEGAGPALNLGLLLEQLGRPDDAELALREALAIDPTCAAAALGLARLLTTRGSHDEALAQLRAGALRGGEPQLWLRAGDLALDLGRPEEAAASYREAAARAPHDADAHNGLGAALAGMRRYDEACAAFAEAVRLEPAFLDAARNLARVTELAGQIDAARALWAQIIDRDPGDAMGRLRAAALVAPILVDRSTVLADRIRIGRELAALGPRAVPLDPATLHLSGTPPPFNLVYHAVNDLELKRAWAACFAVPPGPAPRPPAGGRPHVGFVVTEHHEGLFLRCTGRIVRELGGHGCRATVFCGSAAAAQRVAAAVGPAVAVVAAGQAFAPFLRVLREAGCDVLFYWEVGSDAVNYFLPFFRPARVQVLSWGLNHTSGVAQVSHYLSSPLLDLPGAEAHYSERLVRLPSLPTSYPRPPIPEQPLPRARFDLHDDQHLYLCFQNPRKLHPDFDALLGAILRSDPRGVVVLKGDRPALRDALLARLRASLPDVLDRVRLLPALPERDYLSLVARADVVLDTLHYSGANTSYEALAASVPVVTLPGAFQRGRYSAALYATMGLADGVVGTARAYVERALALGTDRAYRAEVSARIRAAAPALFDRPEPARDLAAFVHAVVAGDERELG